MRVNFNTNNVNFNACYKLGRSYYREQAEAAFKVQAYLNDKHGTGKSYYSIADELEDNGGWDVLVTTGKYLNSASVTLAKGFGFSNSEYLPYRRIYVGDYYKGNVSEIKNDIDAKLMQNSNSTHNFAGAVMLGLLSMLAFTGISRCSTSNANTNKEIVNKSVKMAQDSLNIVKFHK